MDHLCVNCIGTVPRSKRLLFPLLDFHRHSNSMMRASQSSNDCLVQSSRPLVRFCFKILLSLRRGIFLVLIWCQNPARTVIGIYIKRETGCQVVTRCEQVPLGYNKNINHWTLIGETVSKTPFSLSRAPFYFLSFASGHREKAVQVLFAYSDSLTSRRRLFLSHQSPLYVSAFELPSSSPSCHLFFKTAQCLAAPNPNSTPKVPNHNPNPNPNPNPKPQTPNPT